MSKTKIVWHSLDISKILQTLNTKKTGLSSKEASQRNEKYGLNILAQAKKFSAWRLFFSQFKSALVYVLLIAGLVSFIFGEFVDAYVIFAAVGLNVAIGFWQEKKANRSLEQLSKVVKKEAIVLRDGHEIKVEARYLVAGDIILLQAGDRVPADGRLLSINNLKVNEATLTGESWPIEKELKPLDKGTVLAERDNSVFMGTLAVEGRGLAVITHIGVDTEIGKITTMLKETDDEQTPLQKNLDSFAKNITKIIVLIAMTVFFLGLIEGQSMLEMFTVAIALAVSAIPEGLVIGVTMILTMGMRRILQNNGLVRKLVSAETLGSTTLICTDKTGTLTEGEMRVTKIATNKHLIDLATNSLKDEAKDKEIEKLLEIATLCNDSSVQNIDDGFEDWVVLGSPTEKALLLFSGSQHNLDDLQRRYRRKDEIPFDSRYKYMVTRHSYDNRHDIIFIKGAPEKILEFSSSYLNNNKKSNLTEAKAEAFNKTLEDFSKDGLRVLAGAYKLIPKKYPDIKSCEDDPFDLTFVGLWGLSDPLRPETKETLDAALKAGIRTIIITGDNKFTAKKIASDLGLKVQAANILSGDDLLKISDEELDKRIKNIQVYARVTSADKLRIIKAWQKRGEIVSMTGDGVNDAPALKAADIGVVVSSGSDVAKEVADLVLLDNNFKTIVTAIKQGRVIFDNVRKVMLYLLSDSFSEIIIIVVAMLLGWPLPIITAQILWINLVSDGLPNLALTMEPEDEEVMKDRRGAKFKSLLNFEGKFLIGAISIITAMASLALFWFLWNRTGDLDLARTVVFTALGLDTLFYVFSIRNLKHSIFTSHPFQNKYLNMAVLFGIALQVSAIYLPFLNRALHTVPLGWTEWEIILLFLVLVILTIEITKALFILYYKKHKKKYA
ncbi:HAD-IC family P-type ATPase [bacterium]|jgi:P-type Ca2+ transporter type 2C|nr:HAD-IC family P-type ATPase [bacterium]MBT4649129.1 HAD-IC family P-type ATPase [bacterium]